MARASVDDRIALRFWLRVKVTNECWVWTGGRNRQGYGKFSRRNKHIMAHRFSWQWHNGPIPRGLWVLHRCDNPPCIRPDHLFLGTPKDNTRDSVRKGRWKGVPPIGIGERNGRAVITEKQAKKILSLKGIVSGYTVAKMFGLGRSQVYRIFRQEAWKHALKEGM